LALRRNEKAPAAPARGARGAGMNIVILIGVLVTVVTIIPVFTQLNRHPRGLWVLFFAEMWERFSYYGMRGILIFYLTQHFLFEDRDAQGQYGAYTSLVYLLPLIGGFVADRYLGTRKAIAFGALLLVAGHLLMAVEQPPAVQTLAYQGETYRFETTGRMDDREVRLIVDGTGYEVGPAPQGGLAILGLPEGASLPSTLPAGSYQEGVEGRQPFYVNVMFLALSLIIMGVGFLKPNISSIVGQLYGEDDPRRDSGFTLYYYGINLGAFWASILCGYLGQTVGWWAGFGLAGVGMALGYVVFVLGKPLLEGRGEPPDPIKLAAPVAGPLSREWLIYLLALLGVGAVWVLVQRNEAVGVLLGIGSIVVLGYFAQQMATKLNKIERERLSLALVLIAASVVFWTLFEQAGSSLNLFAERNTQLQLAPTETVQVGPFTIDMAFGAAQAQSFNAGFILIFAPVFAGLWAFLERRKRDLSDPMKFALALVQVGAGFLVLVYGAQFANDSFRVPLIFLALAYLLHTTGELFLSPVGLSAMTKLSPAALVSTVMATWFLSSAWAQWLGGFIAQFTAADTVAGKVVDPAGALANYVEVFQAIGLAAIGIGVVLGVLSFWLNRWAHRQH
jgi:POT family proton-dependent oligopeptide transporter